MSGVTGHGSPNVRVWCCRVSALTHGAATNRTLQFANLSCTGGPVSVSWGASFGTHVLNLNGSLLQTLRLKVREAQGRYPILGIRLHFMTNLTVPAHDELTVCCRTDDATRAGQTARSS